MTGAPGTRSVDAGGPTAVRLVRTYETTPERVFAAWTDPGSLGRWLSPEGHAEADVDVRVGGHLRIVMVGDGRRIEHSGTWLEVLPPRRLVFTWQSPYTGPDASRVTVELRALAGGGTELTLVHELVTAEVAASHAGGWTRILDRLALELDGAIANPTGGAA